MNELEIIALFTPAEHDALPGLRFPAPAGTYPGKDASVVFDNVSPFPPVS